MVNTKAILDRVLILEVIILIKELITLLELIRDLIFKKYDIETTIKENKTLVGVNLSLEREAIY